MSAQLYGSFKIVLMGDGGVGKTSLIKRYLKKGFSYDYKKTIGVDFYTTREKIVIKNNLTAIIQWQVWDLGGQPKWHQVRSSFYSGAKGGLLIFDITRRSTFENIPAWANEFIKNAPGVQPLVLVGNKIDLREKVREYVRKEEGEKMAKILSESLGTEIPYVETSALTGTNVRDAFHLLFNLIVKKYFS